MSLDNQDLKPKRNALKKAAADTAPEERQSMIFETPEVSEDDREAIITYLSTIITNSINERTQLDDNLIVYNDLYEGRVPEGKDFPWPDAANINVPITQEMLDGVHARLSKSALGVSPLALVKGEDEEGVELEYKIERYYDSTSRAIDLDEAINQAIFLSLRDGVSGWKIMWELRTRKVKMRVLTPVIDEESGEEIIDPATGKVEREEEIKVLDITEYDNVRAVPFELKDFYVLPSHAYSLDRRHAKGVAERIWMRWDEMNARAQGGQYDKKTVAELKGQAGTRVANTGASNLSVDTNDGEVQISQTEGFEEFEVFEVYMYYDLDKDGYEELCRFAFVPKHDALLRAEVFPYWHQMFPYVLVVPWPRPNRLYGFSVPQRLESVNRELNAIHNQRLDAVSIRLSPPLLITKAAILRGDASQPWGPSVRFEVNGKDDVTSLTLPDINPSSFSEENILRQYAERIIGLYDVNTPRGTGARRTEAEIGAIQTEGLVRYDFMMKQIKRSVVKLFEQMHQLKLQYMPEQETFEAIGIDGAQKMDISREEMLVNFKFLANGDLPAQDKQQERQDSYFLYQALMGNPLVQANPMHMYETTKQLLEAWDSKKIEKLIGTTEELQKMIDMQQQLAAQGGGEIISGQLGSGGPKQAGAGASVQGSARRSKSRKGGTTGK